MNVNKSVCLAMGPTLHIIVNQKWLESTIHCVLIVSPITKVLLKEYKHHTTGLCNSYICGQLALQQVPVVSR